MDFSLSEEQAVVRDLAAEILGARAVSGGGEPFDRTLWQQLAEANLLGIAVPAEQGGSGLGMVELALVLQEAGRAVARVPLLPCLVTGALPVARWGSPAQRAALLPGVVAGDTVLTAALAEPGPAGLDTVTSTLDGGRLRGRKVCVPYAGVATRMVTPAATPDGVVLVLVDPAAPGVTLTPQPTTDGSPEFAVTLDDVAVGADDLLAGADLALLRQHAAAAECALAAGIAAGALKLTADYTGKREQFGRPIAAFQAVTMHAANAYIDVEAMRATALQAAWRLAVGRPAEREVAIAKYWAGTAGHRVLGRAQHLHGGIGVDTDYPLHHYLLAGKRAELAHGSATWHLARLAALQTHTTEEHA
ncbi:acyl-CoA dehydrogenase family protein [Dactylosporangium sp. NPDC000555]|uniref:acyl-CoA dehydrogenase family protein n=1 Tax=Dactylosporangium sp. NPDC000555 TaxID=3154260 RepID=UPI0033266F96